MGREEVQRRTTMREIGGITENYHLRKERKNGGTTMWNRRGTTENYYVETEKVQRMSTIREEWRYNRDYRVRERRYD